jgi:exopolysaccharide production protein ExoZ
MNKKLGLIQVFRGLAATLVLLYHMDPILNQNFGLDFFGGIFNFGFSGVDFFFVISGFIIFYVHQGDLGIPDRVRSFLSKRFVRIYPLYWLVLGAKLLAALVFNYNPASREKSFLDVVKAFLLLPQADGFASEAFLGVSWTLTFEVFFYLIFALAIVASRRFFLPIASIWLTACLLQLLGVIQAKQNFYLEILCSPLNLEFAFGCLTAYLLLHGRIAYEKVILSIGFGLYTVFAIAYNAHFITSVSRAVTFGICAAFIIGGTVGLEMRKAIQVPAILLLIGDASYSIYLMHGFFINNLMKLVVKIYPEIGTNLIALNLSGVLIVAVTIALGCFMHLWIEKPLLTRLGRLSQKKI